MSEASAVKLGDAYEASKDADDSIAEIDAMIPRLVAMRNQLLAQKEYIDVATGDALAPDNTNAQDAMLGFAYKEGFATKGIMDEDKSGKNAKIVDYRVGLFKHQGKVQRIAYDKAGTKLTLEAPGKYGKLAKNGAGVDADVEGTFGVGILDKDIDRGSKRRGGKGTIFKKNEKLAATADGSAVEIEKKDASGIFNGVDLQGTKKFLIGVNAMLTQPNNIDEIGDTAKGYKEAIDGTDVLKPATYEPGGKHIISAGTLRGLLMKGNKNTLTGTANNIGLDLTGGDAKLKAIRGFGL
jgi:hypothetical protein